MTGADRCRLHVQQGIQSPRPISLSVSICVVTGVRTLACRCGEQSPCVVVKKKGIYIPVSHQKTPAHDGVSLAAKSAAAIHGIVAET